MKYMLLIYSEEQAWTEGEREDCFQKSTDYARELDKKGQFLGASPLQPASTATKVTMQGGKRVIMDGPFAESREQLAGYFLVEARDLDEAIAIASQLPSAPKSTIEIRPLVELEGLPDLDRSERKPMATSLH